MSKYLFKTKVGADYIDISTVVRSGTQTSNSYGGFTYSSTSYANSKTGAIQGFSGMPTDMSAPNGFFYSNTGSHNVPAQARYATILARGGGGGSGGGSGGVRNMQGLDGWMRGGSGGTGAGGPYSYKKIDLTHSNGAKIVTINIGGGGGGGGGGGASYGNAHLIYSNPGQNGQTGSTTVVEIKEGATLIDRLDAPGGTGGGGGPSILVTSNQNGSHGTGPSGSNSGTVQFGQSDSNWEPNSIVSNSAPGGAFGGSGGTGDLTSNRSAPGSPGNGGGGGAVSIIWIYGG
jgi:hypothetical protein